MRKLKNSKYRNTGFIFEVLVKNVTSEVLSENKQQPALSIIKKYFKKDSELLKEFQIYKTLSEPNRKESISDKLIDAVKDIYRKIDLKKLQTEKYRLIGELNKKYNIKEFFNTNVEKYKLYASIYKVLNYNISSNPEEYLNNHQVIKEYITSKPSIQKTTELNDSLLNEIKDRDESILVFKTIVNKFNSKYSSFLPEQKKILAKYVNENTTTESFLRFVQLEANKQKTQLTEIIKIKNIDPVQKIKLKELVKLLETIELTKKVKSDHVSALLKYCELINLLGKK